MTTKASTGGVSRTANGEIAAEELEPLAFVFTGEEFNARFRDSGPSTPDDVTITPEGFRLDTKQAVLDFIALVDAERAAKAIHDDSPSGG
jgi:hypothetical protein